MAETLAYLWPEVTLFLATCVVMVVGLSPSAAVRRLCPLICGISLAAAGIFAIGTTPTGPEHTRSLMPSMLPYAKAIIAAVGILLVMLLAGTVDREEEANIEKGRTFDPLRLNSGEFYSFFLFSLTGLMLTASADTLIWLFLALELTSLPTYVMVTISTARSNAREAGVKYFFLGALGAAIFLYGFTLIYGGTGSVHLTEIRHAITTQMAGEGLNPITLAGILLAIIGIGFKIAAVPMHYYTADVYQGAATPVTAMLAFVPKTAGFLALMLVCSTIGWHYGESGAGLPDAVRLLLWVMAVMSMTLGNVLALLQTSMKRMLAYSSIAHSGYMLVGLIAGPGDTFTQSGLSAVLFYLLSYGVMSTGAFAVIASLERNPQRTHTGELAYDEADSIEAIRGLARTKPLLGWSLVICALSLLGFPLTIGFFGKLPLFTAGISAGEIGLVVILGLNSAIAAFYYLRLVAYPLFDEAGDEARAFNLTPMRTRPAVGALGAAGVVLMTVFAGPIARLAHNAVHPDSQGHVADDASNNTDEPVAAK
ncbi:MAG: NADH-quinone oxidoreductase subunit N [Phycisphaerales bacterium]|nr:NADH-quinone oxidoreductase subunit N [Phycisphaerales bacterium]MCB9835218.1 NADH-quinone oxidoreductase subunit N [Phycisphaera sp.]